MSFLQETPMAEPTVLFKHTHFLVALFGGEFHALPRAAAETWLQETTKQRLAYEIIPPSGEKKPGFKNVLQASSTYKVSAEGMVIPPDTAVSILSKDCAIVTAFNRQTGVLAVTHTGRAALTGSSEACPSCSFTVLTQLFSRVAPRGSDCSQVELYVTGSICGHCFQHEQPTAQSKLEFFKQHYPNAIVGRYGLDQFTVIKEEALRRGVLREHIYHDELCTREDPRLSSLRGNTKGTNLTMVVNLQT